MKFCDTYRGFTLTELLVVIAIIGALSSVVLLSLNSSRDKSENTTTMKQVREYITAIQLTYKPNGDEFPWNGAATLNQYGCLSNGGCSFNGGGQPTYPDLNPLPDYIEIQPAIPVTDGQGHLFDSVMYSSNGQDFRLRYTLKGEIPVGSDEMCGVDGATIFRTGAADPAYPGVTVCEYESR